MQKIGMKEEGRLRRHIFRWGEYRDMVLFGIMREEWPPGAGK
jgi:RimJ/RimL family protein N-acetyltransferase